jgi:hypothetical protein
MKVRACFVQLLGSNRPILLVLSLALASPELHGHAQRIMRNDSVTGRFGRPSRCYRSVHSLLSSSLLSRNVKVKIYKTIFLPAVLSGCEP